MGHLLTVANAIAELDFGAIRVKMLREIPLTIYERDCPVLYPEPAGFVTEYLIVRESTGTPTGALKTRYYTLNYTFLYAPIGEGRMGLDKYDHMVDMVDDIMGVISANDYIDGAVNIEPVGTPVMGLVPAPDGSTFLGCKIAFRVTDYPEVVY